MANNPEKINRNKRNKRTTNTETEVLQQLNIERASIEIEL